MTGKMWALPVPCMLLIFTSCIVAIWMHVVGHTSSAAAESSHIAPVVLLSSMVTAAGVVSFFLFHVCLSFLCRAFNLVLRMCMNCSQFVWESGTSHSMHSTI